MKRHEMWRFQYRQLRYMEHLSVAELKQRARDIFLNITTINNENKIIPVSLNEGGFEWIRLFTHICEEFVIRFGPYPAGFTDGFIKETPIPNPGLENSVKACKIVKKLNLQAGSFFVKFGKYCHMRDAIEKGSIRIAPASFYSDTSLNPAIKDNELQISFEIHPSYLPPSFLNTMTSKYKNFPLNKNLKIIEQSSKDYYVYCLSSTFAPRLFLDFEANSCLLIFDKDRFISLLQEEFAKTHPDWKCYKTSVRYFDPLFPKKDDLNVFRSKHFRHTYQKEYRILWIPPKSIEKSFADKCHFRMFKRLLQNNFIIFN